MKGQSSTQDADALLLSLRRATDLAESNQLLDRLINNHAIPIIRSVVKRKLGLSCRDDRAVAAQDEEDVQGEVVVQLVGRLNIHDASPTINDFQGYVAVVTYNACNHYLRRKYPQRWRLKNRVRYLLNHHTAFALWETPGADWVCGLDAWRRSRRDPLPSGRLQSLRDNPAELSSVAVNEADLARLPLPELLAAIFNWSQAPIPIDDLVNTVAALQGVIDQPLLATDEESENQPFRDRMPDKRVSIATDVERTSYLARVWTEILQLPLPQRVALLLNLRDSQEGVLELLPVSGVATIRQIAEALEISALEFAEIWNDLPLDDSTLAVRLGVQRQQVVNLRKAARARLGRRMKVFGFI
jgi:hypothetical protein